MARGPVWNSSGSSASIRNWLNVKPVGADVGHEGREAVDAVGDLVDSGLHHGPLKACWSERKRVTQHAVAVRRARRGSG